MSRGECFCSGHAVSLAAARVRANVGVQRRVGRWCPLTLGPGGCTQGQGLSSSPFSHSVTQWRLKRRSLVNKQGART